MATMSKMIYAKWLLLHRDQTPRFKALLWYFMKRNEGLLIAYAFVIAMLVVYIMADKDSGFLWLLIGVMVGRLIDWVRQIRSTISSSDMIREFTDWGKVEEASKGQV